MEFLFPGKAAGPLLLILAASAQLCAQAPRTPPSPAPKGSMLLLQYRWRHDTLTLVYSERVPAAIKPSRSSPGKRARGLAAMGGEPRSPFSFELLDAEGKWIATRYLRDPGIRRVEYREKGLRALKVQEESVDSSDIFLRIPEADAKTIRFHRHAEHFSPSGPSAPKPASKASANPLASKSLVAEFPLE